MSKISFSEKLKIIKNCYQLQSKELAEILCTVYRNYQKYETGITMPAFDKVVELSNFFCISLDWIGGTTDYPYNEEQILSKEKEIFSSNEKGELAVYFDASNGEHIKIFPYFCIKDASIPKQYSDLELRKKFYTLNARSNIIYLINKCKKMPMCFFETVNLLQQQLNNPQMPIYNLNIFARRNN